MNIIKSACPECGGEPTDIEVQEAIARYESTGSGKPRICDACGFQIKVLFVVVRRQKRYDVLNPGIHTSVIETRLEPYVIAYKRREGTEIEQLDAVLHESCYTRLFQKGPP